MDSNNLDSHELLSPLAELRSEAEIVATWQGDTTKPMVSIICATFNHVDYLKYAIHGFLAQETTFPFEIIINDDASVDGTTEVVKEYSSLYPRIIKPIFHKENQFSQGVKPSSYTYPLAKGKYIAICEGDDYWIRNDKLAKQYAAMETNKRASVCFHSALEFDELLKKSELVCSYSDRTKIIPPEIIITNRGGSMTTAALFYRNEGIEKMLQSYKNAPIGDFFLQSYLSLKGEVIYLPEPMCIYRRNAKGSWTSGQQDKTKQSLYYKEMIKAIDSFYGNVQNFEHSHNLSIPLVFYLKAYLLQNKKPIPLLRAYYEQVSSLEHFKKSEVTQLLAKELQTMLLKKAKYILSKRKNKHEL